MFSIPDMFEVNIKRDLNKKIESEGVLKVISIVQKCQSLKSFYLKQKESSMAGDFCIHDIHMCMT